jgi:hypothetical protein
MRNHPTNVSSKLALSIPIANISPVDLSLQPKATGPVRERLDQAFPS